MKLRSHDDTVDAWSGAGPPAPGFPLETLFDSMQEGMIVVDPMGNITQFNPAALRILGLTADELRGKTARDPDWRVVNEDMSPCPPESFPGARALRSGQIVRNEKFGVQNASGMLRWLTVTAVPLKDVAMRTTLGALVTFQDVTEHKRAVDELSSVKRCLEERERFLDVTLGALPSLVSYVDPSYTYRFVNKAYAAWFGVAIADCVGRALPDLLGRAAFEAIRPMLDRALRGETVQFEREVPYRDQKPRHVQVSYVPDRDPGGNVKGVFATVHDVSPLVEARTAIESHERELERLLDNLPALIGYWDKDLRNRHANRAYVEYFGKAPRELSGKHMREALGDTLFEKNAAYIQGVLAGRPQRFEREMALADGSSRHTVVSYLPDVRDGVVEGFFVIAADVSELKGLERERREFEARLYASAKLSSLGEMAGGIAHEINSPLTIIRGLAGRLKRRLKEGALQTEAGLADLSSIELTVDRIAKIIRGLRAFSRNADGDPMTITRIDDIIAETLELCRERFQNAGVSLRIVVNASAELECRSVQISQVLMNLLGNALDAVEALAEKWVELRVDVGENELVCSVTDSGRGISPEIADKIMQPFFTTKEVGKGTGLGLSISTGIAKMHRGELAYDAQSPHTRFVLTLPLAKKPRGS